MDSEVGIVSVATLGANPVRQLALLSLMVLITPTIADEAKKPEKLQLTPEETAIIEGVNAERAKHALPALKPHPRLFAAARSHAANMAQQQKFAHDLDGKSAFDRITASGYQYGYAAENIGWNYRTPQDAIAGWMASDAHRANILNPHHIEIGVGRAKSTQGESYWVQVFASPKTTTPTPQPGP